jgi:glucokinase
VSERLSIGIDIGGTKLAAGVVDRAGRIVARSVRTTPSVSAEDLLEAIASVTAELRRDHDIFAIGIGAAGYVDATGSTVLFSPHLAWRHEPLREAVSSRTHLAVHLDNDANACAWAEARFGAARYDTDVVVLTLGTGIGGCLLIDGQPYRGRFGLAGEFGHMRVEPGGRPCECGNAGCWEQYASGRVLNRRAQAEVAAGTVVGRLLLDAASGELAAVDGALVGRLARDGHGFARDWIAEVGHWLGEGMASLAAAFDPSLFVVGGGVSNNAELLLEPAQKAFSQALTGRGFRPEARIVRAQLGADAGLIGAADMARLTARRRRRASRRRPVRAAGVATSGRSLPRRTPLWPTR